MPYIVIVNVDENNRVSKYQPCKTEAEAQAHVAKVDKLGYQNAFYVKDPGVGIQWVIPNVAAKTITIDRAGMAQYEIDMAAQQIENKRKQQEFRNSIKYQQRLVAFLDILAWSKAINRTQTDPEFLKDLVGSLQIFNALQSQTKWMQEQARSQGWKEWPGDTRITQFSDCIVLSFSPDDRGKQSMLMLINTICNHFLRMGFFIRGGIVLGELFHNNHSVLGPALVEAYRLESESAIYPRILLQKRLAAVWGQGDEYHNQDGVHLGYTKTWRKSDDGWSYFDCLQSFNAVSPFPSPGGVVQVLIENVLESVVKGLKEHSRGTSIWSKYEWFAKYVNEVLEEYPQIKLSKIDIQ